MMILLFDLSGKLSSHPSYNVGWRIMEGCPIDMNAYLATSSFLHSFLRDKRLIASLDNVCHWHTERPALHNTPDHTVNEDVPASCTLCSALCSECSKTHTSYIKYSLSDCICWCLPAYKTHHDINACQPFANKSQGFLSGCTS